MTLYTTYNTYVILYTYTKANVSMSDHDETLGSCLVHSSKRFPVYYDLNWVTPKPRYTNITPYFVLIFNWSLFSGKSSYIKKHWMAYYYNFETLELGIINLSTYFVGSTIYHRLPIPNNMLLS